MKHNQWIQTVAILLVFLTAGCTALASITPQSSSVVEITPTSSDTSRMATSIATFTPSFQPPTSTVIASVQISPAIPRPTLPADEAKTLVFDLLQNNGGCRLPCLWSLTPGETDPLTFDYFMSQFGNLVSPDVYVSTSEFGELGGFTLILRENYVHIDVDLSYYKNKEVNELDLLALRGYAMQERGKDPDWLSPEVSPLYGDPSFNQAFEYYLLPQILSNYGPPNQVLLAPFPDDPDRTDIKWHPFSLVLLYLDKGIFVEYVSPRETIGSNFVGCSSKADISLAVWSPESGLPMKYVIQKAGSEINELNMDYFKPVDEATSMTQDEFYQNFKDPNNTACLETPMELWLSP